MWRGKGTERYGKRKDLAAMRPGGTRVPTPNTRVKARAADGTVLGMGEQEAARFSKKTEYVIVLPVIKS